MKPALKNFKPVRRIDSLGVFLTLIDQNKRIYLEGMGKVISARFIKHWHVKKMESWILRAEVWEVVPKNNVEKIGVTVQEATKALHRLGSATAPILMPPKKNEGIIYQLQN